MGTWSTSTATKTGWTEDKRHGHYQQKTVEIQVSTKPTSTRTHLVYFWFPLPTPIPYHSLFSVCAALILCAHLMFEKLRPSLCVFVRNGSFFGSATVATWRWWHFSGRLSFGVPFFSWFGYKIKSNTMHVECNWHWQKSTSHLFDFSFRRKIDPANCCEGNEWAKIVHFDSKIVVLLR